MHNSISLHNIIFSIFILINRILTKDIYIYFNISFSEIYINYITKTNNNMLNLSNLIFNL